MNPQQKLRQALEEVQSSRDEFQAWVLANFRETQSSAASTGREGGKEIDQSKTLLSIREALSQAVTYEEVYSFIEPFSVVNEPGNAIQARSELSRRRTQGIRKIGYGFQKFAVTFLQCLRAFKGVVNIAESANPGWWA